VLVLDLKGGTLHLLDVSAHQGAPGLLAYVVNARGTLVALHEEPPTFCSADCVHYHDYIDENDQRSSRDGARRLGEGVSTRPRGAIPASSLGLSVTGGTVYWSDNGSLESASIP
jgi:hypothetical protein